MITNLLDFLINMLFIILPIVAYQALLLNSPLETIKSSKKQKLLLAIMFSISSVLCLLFPVHLGEGLLDLRIIPFIIGTLYGGVRVGAVVLLTTLGLRYMVGGSGFYISLVEYGIVAFMLLRTIKQFPTFSLKKKVSVSAWICILPTILGLPIAFFVYDITAVYLGLVLIAVSIICILCSIYLLESTIERLHTLIELHKVDKMSIVSHLAASVSHEVRNPLTVTKGFIQLLKNKYSDNEEDRLYFDLALEGLVNAETIITDYLTFAKPAFDKVEVLELGEELQKIIKVVSPFAAMHNINISYDGSYVPIEGDRLKIHQLFLNILKNSIEAMPNGGELSILLLHDKEDVKVIIKDTGFGMSKEQLLRLGEPYFSTKQNGTGLGMMVSLNILKSLGGAYKVYSKPNEGTTFYITFPALK
ncbi:ATP-binding protein [Bacillus pinisoli]|uniref:ATP-binding protein n=1 Tax=Bacillus pinisoli TaxID=2901866 RepID=UPI001FF0E7F5|nr:ATP-binding protein [Bacillus pinisoli]